MLYTILGGIIMKTLPVALQLFTVRDEAAKDFAGTMKKVREMGYEYVEPAGLYGIPADEFRRILDENGLSAICAHVPIVEMINDLDKTLADYKTIGCRYIAVPYLPDDMRPGTDGFEGTLAAMRKIGEASVKMGMPLLYHNHDFEFVKMPDGRFALDYMYDTLPPEILQTELDVCWVKVAGQEPVEYIMKYSGRAPIVHLKDFVGEKSEKMYELIVQESANKPAPTKFEFRPVGYGVQDFPPILAAAVDAGAEYVVVEQDAWQETSLEAAKKSREFLKTLGW
jgi:sugar phosphate isomerase/epimerase